MAAKGIPGVINDFNLYLRGTKLVGITGEVKLPDLEPKTSTLSGPGILGEMEEPIVGQFNSMEIEIPFRILDEEAFRLMSPIANQDITLRAAEQFTNKSTQAIDMRGMRVVIRGRQKKLVSGKFAQGDAMEATITIEISYYMVEQNGQKKLELDKLNSVYNVCGNDYLAKLKKLC